MPKELTIKIGAHSYAVVIDEETYFVNENRIDFEQVQTAIDGKMIFCHSDRFESALLDMNGMEGFVQFHGREFPVQIETKRDRLVKQFSSAREYDHQHSEVKALMPGLIVRLIVSQGQQVIKGDPLLILEAMKMENEIRATADGVVKEIRFQQGQTVEKGDVLIVLE
jgi:biotin carboxyl carrier protein